MPDDTAQAAETALLPPLTDAMTARDLWQHEKALRSALGACGDTIVYTRENGVHITLYPVGLLSSTPGYRAERVAAPAWPEAFTAARAWLATHATVHRDNRIRAMALAIIDFVDQHGRCDRAMLTRRDFSAAEVDDLKDAACQRASEMSANAPFVVEG